MQSGKSWKTSLLEMAFITHGWGPPFEVVPGKGGHHPLKQTESEMGLQAAIATGGSGAQGAAPRCRRRPARPWRPQHAQQTEQSNRVRKKNRVTSN